MSLLGGTETFGPQTIAANGESGMFNTPDVSMLAVEVTIATGSASGQMDMWLMGSCDGVNFVDAIADLALATADNAASGTVNANVRDIVPAKTTTAAEQFTAIYKHWPYKAGKLKWKNSGLSLPTTVRITGK